ncbi:MAG: Glutathione-regulated potassium-efflux system protein KefC [Myxococcota bacterium]|nr:Glutathione-regulated potassium-efflux system protein KefC [Myxococcota bacterium]
MGHIPLLEELALIAALGAGVTVVFSYLRLPPVAGLIMAGILLGPHGLGLVSSPESIGVLAELGVVLLLFSIGLEFNLSRLRNMMGQAALGGVLQVALTAAASTGVALFFGMPLPRAVLLGFVMALSSTAIVLRALKERNELEAPHGRIILGILIFQDLCVVPMVIITPLLAADAGAVPAAAAVGKALALAAAVVAAVVGGARLVIPRFLRAVAESGSREVFLLAVLAVCIGASWLTSLAGLSLALGAFLGGMVIADTDYGAQAATDIGPLRDAFVSVFFVSLGMLFNPLTLLEQPVLTTALLGGFLLFKGALATAVALMLRFPARVAWLAGAGLAQFGEFGFVLLTLGVESKVADEAFVRPLLSAGVISMFLTPIIVRVAPHVSAGARLLAPLEKLIGVRGIDEADRKTGELHDHVVIAGYGLAGRLTAEALTASGIPYVVIEINPDSIHAARQITPHVYYGDASSHEVLAHAYLRNARALVVLINDQRATERIVRAAREAAPNVPILTRTRYVKQRADVFEAGANEVVAEELEGSIEMIARLLRRLDLPRNIIDQRIHAARDKTGLYQRRLTAPRKAWAEHPELAEIKVETVVVEPSGPVGMSPADLQLRQQTGVTIVAMARNGAIIQNPDPREPLQAGDKLFLVGSLDAVAKALPILSRCEQDSAHGGWSPSPDAGGGVSHDM